MNDIGSKRPGATRDARSSLAENRHARARDIVSSGLASRQGQPQHQASGGAGRSHGGGAAVTAHKVKGAVDRAKVAFLRRAINRRKAGSHRNVHEAEDSTPSRSSQPPTVVHTPDGDIMIPYFPAYADASSPVSVQLMASAGVDLAATAIAGASPSDTPTRRAQARLTLGLGGGAESPSRMVFASPEVVRVQRGGSKQAGTPDRDRRGHGSNGASPASVGHAAHARLVTAAKVVPSPDAARRLEQQRELLARQRAEEAEAQLSPRARSRARLMKAAGLQPYGGVGGGEGDGDGGGVGEDAETRVLMRMAELDDEEHQVRLDMAQAESMLAHLQVRRWCASCMHMYELVHTRGRRAPARWRCAMAA